MGGSVAPEKNLPTFEFEVIKSRCINKAAMETDELRAPRERQQKIHLHLHDLGASAGFERAANTKH